MLQDVLRDYKGSLPLQSVDRHIEEEYFDKFDGVRNMYVPESLRQQAQVSRWFLGGSDVPNSVKDYLHEFWWRHVPATYSKREVDKVKCPKYDASAGVVYRKEGAEFGWDYCSKGPFWDQIQEGTKEWEKAVIAVVPKEWLDLPISALVGFDNLSLERLALERPVIRKEGGPGKVRYARSSSGNVYILGRQFVTSVQDSDRWSASPSYIGRSVNAQVAGILSDEEEDWYIGTHGDDWIAWCPKCRVWHSGDWSNWDLHLSARLILASYEALFDRICSDLSESEVRLYYALAYLAVRTPTIWLWDAEGRKAMSVRRTLGHVRSGSGDFVMHNNAVNFAVLSYLLRKVHGRLDRGLPCKSNHWWPHLSMWAQRHFGMVLKPSAQFTHPHGFVACRCIFTEEDRFSPRPSVASVVRNWVNPSYDPEEFPNNTPVMMYLRFLDLNKTLAWSPKEIQAKVMDAALETALLAGVEDPTGAHFSNAALSRYAQILADPYSTSAYLGGEKHEYN